MHGQSVKAVCTVAQWALNVAMTANPIGIIIVAIGALIAIGVALWMNWDSICALVQAGISGVGDFFVSGRHEHRFILCRTVDGN